MKEYSALTKGLIKDLDNFQLSPEQYIHALNLVLESTESGFLPQNDSSNILGFILAENENVIYKKYISELNKIILFTTNNRILELSSTNYTDENYNTFDAQEGSTPIIPVGPILIGKELIQSDCFNWTIQNKVKMKYKITDDTVNFYFVDGKNEDSYIYFNLINNELTLEDSFKTIIGYDTYTQPIYSEELNCNAIKWYPDLSTPQITNDVVEGGNLKAGVYQFLVSYSTSKGISLTNYKAATNPFNLFTQTLTTETDYNTGKAIVVNIDNLSVESRYRFINLAVAETINGVTTFKLIATLPINFKIQYIYTGDAKAITLDETTIFNLFPFYKSSDGITKGNNRLFKFGLKEFDKFNLQPIAHRFKFKWFTIVAQEGDFANPVFAQNYRPYLRDEVYPIGIEFITNNGEKIPVITSINRDKNDLDRAPIAIDNKDNAYTEDECKELKLKEYWEVYNTATVTKTRESELNRCDYKLYQEGDFAYWESTELYPNNPNVWGVLANTPIRHFKFPDCLVSPIHNGTVNDAVTFEQKNLIYPIGIKLADDVNVDAILQEAVNLGYITADQKNRIVDYKIVRGNRTNNKSIQAKGYLYNTRQYLENGKQVDFANYPFNDLRPDPYLSSQDLDNFDLEEYKQATTKIEVSDLTKYTFHSPDTHYTSPALGTTLKIEQESYGQAKGFFNQSKGEGEYVILSQLHYNFAITIAYLLTSRLQLSKSQPGAQGSAIGGGIGGVVGGVVGSVVPGIGTAAGAIVGSGLGTIIGRLVGGNTADDDYNAMYRLSMWISQTDRILELLNNTIPLQNYHWQYQAVGKYQNSLPVLNAGFKIRRIVTSQYLAPERQLLPNDIRVNNFKRESSVFLKLDEPLQVPKIQDTSRFIMSQTGDCESDGEELTSNISSFYASIKREVLNQYGNIFSIDWLPTSNKVWKLNEIAKEFGGDTFIGREAIKIKHSFFNDTSYGLPDRTDVYYEDKNNIAYPFFFFNTRYTELKVPATINLRILSGIENSYPLILALNNIESPQTITDNVVPWTANEGLQNAIGQLFKYSLMNPYVTVRPGRYNIDCESNNFVEHRPNDLLQVPARSNWWKNTFGEGDVDKFIPNSIFNFAGVKGKIYTYSYGIPYYICESDINVDLRHAENADDRNFYPNITDLNYWLQPDGVYEPIDYDNVYLYNRTYSKQNHEDVLLKNDINFYKDLNKTYFQNKVIYSQDGADVEDSDFKDPYLYFKPLDSKNFSYEDGKLISVDAIESGTMLVRFENGMGVFPLNQTLQTEQGESISLGSGVLFNSYQEFSKTELGYIGSQHTDMLNTPFGHIIIDAKRGNVFNLQPGAKGIDELTKEGVRNWMVENLPFKINKYFPTIDIDNTYNNIGIALCYDNRFKRIFITKRDYIPLNKDIQYIDGKFYLNQIEIDIRNSQYFCDASWTISYSFYSKAWTSFHSFTPNYYIDALDVFYTGLNGIGRGASSLWVHNITNKSFQTYYGKLHPFEIEGTGKPTLIDEILKDVSFKLDVIRYHNKYDKSYINNISFNKAIISNEIQNSGLLELELIDKEDLFKRRVFPIREYDKTRILLDKNESLFSFNQFEDLAIRNNLPRFLNSCNNVNKSINQKTINYNNFKLDNNLIRGRNFVKLINDKHDKYKFVFKGMLNDNLPSIR